MCSLKTNHDIKLGVSLYCYQDNYYFHKYDLEGCLAAAAGSGAEGFEIFPDAMIPEWPYISDAFVDRFNGLKERYGLKCVCVDHFSDTRMWKNKNLTDDDLYERGVMYIKAAAKLGAPAIRLMHDEHMGVFDQDSPMKRDYHLTNVAIAKRLLPVAAEYNVMMALECHAPSSVDDPCQRPYLEMAEQMGLPFIGLQADFSTYAYCISSADVGMYIRQGATPKILNFIRDSQRDAYFKGEAFDYDGMKEKIDKMGPNEVDRKAWDFIYSLRCRQPVQQSTTSSGCGRSRRMWWTIFIGAVCLFPCATRFPSSSRPGSAGMKTSGAGGSGPCRPMTASSMNIITHWSGHGFTRAWNLRNSIMSFADGSRSRRVSRWRSESPSGATKA